VGGPVTLRFKGQTLEGRFSGRAEIGKDKTSDQLSIETDFSDIQIGRIPALQGLSDRKIAGRLEGSLLHSGEGPDSITRIAATLFDGEVELLTPIPNLDSIAFRTLTADLILDGGGLQVERCEFVGSQVEGHLLGTIRLQKPFGESRIDLKGRLRPQPEFMSDLRKVIPEGLLPRKRIRNGFPITLKGTLASPVFLPR